MQPVVHFSKDLEVITTRSRGRTVAACCDISPGTELVREAPLACVPLAESPCASLSLQRGPFAASAVEMNMLQFSSAKGYPGVGRTAMLAVRCLLALERESQQRRQLWDALVYHTPTSNAERERLAASAAIAHRLLLFSAPAIAERLTLRDCEIALLKLAANAFTVLDEALQECGHALFLRVAAMNHSCAPNCVQGFETAHGELRVTIRAVRRILRGEEICISYTDPTRPRWWRQRELSAYSFRCGCPRCCNRGSDEDNRESYRCIASPSCRGEMKYDHSSENSQDIYIQWMQGQCKPMRADNEAESAAVDQELKSLSLPIPFGDRYARWRAGINREKESVMLYCSLCDKSVRFEALAPHIDRLCSQYKDALQKVRSASASSERDEHRSVLSAFSSAQKTLALADKLIVPTHCASDLCLSLCIDSWKTMLSKGLLPPETKSWSRALRAFLELRIRHEIAQCSLSPCLHPLLLIEKVADLSLVVALAERWLPREYRSESDESSTKEVVRLLRETFESSKAQITRDISICCGEKHPLWEGWLALQQYGQHVLNLLSSL